MQFAYQQEEKLLNPFIINPISSLLILYRSNLNRLAFPENIFIPFDPILYTYLFH